MSTNLYDLVLKMVSKWWNSLNWDKKVEVGGMAVHYHKMSPMYKWDCGYTDRRRKHTPFDQLSKSQQKIVKWLQVKLNQMLGLTLNLQFNDNYKLPNDMNLIVTDHGDPSVGIMPQTWSIPCPFSTAEVDKEGLQYFATEIGKLYQEFSESGRVSCEYDFELQYSDIVEFDPTLPFQ